MSDQKICPTCGTEYPLSERFCPRDGSALRAADPQADLLGSIVADRYHILKKLGEGGMGTVYLAEHVKMGRKSALKVMNPGMNTDPDAIARFNREASNASRLSHPNICGIYDFGETSDGMIYLAMEFIEGSSLTSLIEKAGSLPPARAGSIIHQSGDALQVAHDAGIVHRDLKPDNIMIAKNRDGSDLVKVVDFGIAKASSSDAQKVTKTGLVVGTPEYMSPEQLAGDKLDGRSDIYSLGLVAFNCLTGHLPFASESAQEAMIMRLTDRPRSLADVRPDLVWPDGLQAVMDKALARDAAERYQSAAQFGREFAAAIADMPTTQAIEAGTLVMSATKVSSAGSQVPATRVSSPGDGATKAINTAPTKASRRPAPTAAVAASASVAAKKSAMPMVLVGAGGVAAIAVVVWQMGLLGGATPSGGPALVPPPQKAETTAVVDPGATKIPADAGTKATVPNVPTGQKVPDATPGKSTPPRANPPNGTKSGGAAQPTGTGTTPDVPPTSVMTQLAKWLDEVNTVGVTPATARKVLGDLEPLQRTLSGLQLAESRFVEMIAYAAMEDENGACRAARLVKQLHNDRSRLIAADRIIGGCP